MMRRCEENVLEMEAARDLQPNIKGRKGAQTRKTITDAPEPQVVARREEKEYESDDRPSVAKQVRGAWHYGRAVATPRGKQLRWFAGSAFTQSELDSDHVRSLRTQVQDASDPAILAVISLANDWMHATAA